MNEAMQIQSISNKMDLLISLSSQIPHLPSSNESSSPTNLQQLKAKGLSIPAIEAKLSNLSVFSPENHLLMSNLRLFKIVCIKSSLTKFQESALFNYADYLWACYNVEKMSPMEREISKPFQVIGGDFNQYDLRTDLGMLEANTEAVLRYKDHYKIHFDKDVEKRLAMIDDCKLAILQILKGFVSLFVNLIQIAHPTLVKDIYKYLQVTGLAFLFSGPNSFDQLPHADAIEQLRLSLLIYSENGKPTRYMMVNDQLD
ncbi:hypothetical protein HDU76_011395, partial [Blyttiomyces sp. JEL0837]